MAEYTIHSEHASIMAIDQHARSVTIAGLDFSSGEARTTRLTNSPSPADIAQWASGWAVDPIRFVYESGPCGFQLARDLRRMGFSCDVIAVSSIPRSIEDKQQKDDKRDAQRLLDAVVSPNSKCKTVVIPSEEAEAARDLVRTYYDLVLATKRLKCSSPGCFCVTASSGTRGRPPETSGGHGRGNTFPGQAR